MLTSFTQFNHSFLLAFIKDLALKDLFAFAASCKKHYALFNKPELWVYKLKQEFNLTVPANCHAKLYYKMVIERFKGEIDVLESYYEAHNILMRQFPIDYSQSFQTWQHNNERLYCHIRELECALFSSETEFFEAVTALQEHDPIPCYQKTIASTWHDYLNFLSTLDASQAVYVISSFCKCRAEMVIRKSWPVITTLINRYESEWTIDHFIMAVANLNLPLVQLFIEKGMSPQRYGELPKDVDVAYWLTPLHALLIGCFISASQEMSFEMREHQRHAGLTIADLLLANGADLSSQVVMIESSEDIEARMADNKGQSVQAICQYALYGEVIQRYTDTNGTSVLKLDISAMRDVFDFVLNWHNRQDVAVKMSL